MPPLAENGEKSIKCIQTPFRESGRLWFVIVAFLGKFQLQSALVISNSKGLTEILRDIRTSTYQICRIEEKLIRTTTFNKYICDWTLEVRDILKILWKRGEIAPEEQFLLFSTIFLPVVRFSCLCRDKIITSR